MTSDTAGTLAEEAARLVAAMQSWADDREDGSAEQAHDPLSPACRYCPLCSLARLAMGASPEVRDHLVGAVTSLALAAKALLETVPERAADPSPVEKIDLTED